MPVTFATIIFSGLLLLTSVIAVYKWYYHALLALLPLLGLIFYKYNSDIAIFLYFSQAILVGSLIGYNLRNEKSTQFLLISSGLLFSIFFLGYYFFLQKQYGIELIDYYISDFKVQIAEINTHLTKEQQKETINMTKMLLKMAFPFAFFTKGVFLTIIFYIPVKLVYILAYLRSPMKSKGIEFFKIHDNWVYLLIGCILALIAMSGNKAGILFFLVLNVLLILLAIYFFQALGIIKFIMIKKKLPLYFSVIVIVLLMLNLLFLTFSIIILTGIGVLDIWADFRKLNLDTDK